MWYAHQKMCIRLGNAIAPYFTVSNVFSGIISPIHYNVYMDGLSVLLNSSITLEHKLDALSLIIYVIQMICV